MHRRLPVLVAVIACGLAPGAARAGSPFYGSVRAGAFVPTGAEAFSGGFDVELAGGWQVTPGLALEISAGRGSAFGKAGYEEPPGEPVYTRVTLFPLLATVRGSFWLGSLRPYLLGGAGVTIVRNRPEIAIPGEAPLSTAWTEGALSLTGGAGLVYQADEKWAFGVEGRYAHAEVNHEGTASFSGVTVGATMEIRL